MYCPACGVEDNQESARFCRACGADLRAVSRAMSKSLPVRIASTLDEYLENRFQRNFANGVLNLVAFVALLAVGAGSLVNGWLKLGIFMLALSALSLFLGVWDIWIYRRNLPPTAKPALPTPTAATNELPLIESRPPLMGESTTKTLEILDE